MLVPVALLKNRLLVEAVAANKLVEVLFVVEALVANRLVVVELVVVALSVREEEA